MSRFISAACFLLLVAAVSIAPAIAQTAGAPPAPEVGNAVLVARYQCNPAEHAKVDRILKEVVGPIIDRNVAEGKLVAWGVLATSVGGPETRTIYVWAKDAVALMQARAAYLPEIMGKPEWAELARACPTQETSINTMIVRSKPVTK